METILNTRLTQWVEQQCIFHLTSLVFDVTRVILTASVFWSLTPIYGFSLKTVSERCLLWNSVSILQRPHTVNGENNVRSQFPLPPPPIHSSGKVSFFPNPSIFNKCIQAGKQYHIYISRSPTDSAPHPQTFQFIHPEYSAPSNSLQNTLRWCCRALSLQLSRIRYSIQLLTIVVSG